MLKLSFDNHVSERCHIRQRGRTFTQEYILYKTPMFPWSYPFFIGGAAFKRTNRHDLSVPPYAILRPTEQRGTKTLPLRTQSGSSTTAWTTRAPRGRGFRRLRERKRGDRGGGGEKEGGSEGGGGGSKICIYLGIHL